MVCGKIEREKPHGIGIYCFCKITGQNLNNSFDCRLKVFSFNGNLSISLHRKLYCRFSNVKNTISEGRSTSSWMLLMSLKFVQHLNLKFLTIDDSTVFSSYIANFCPMQFLGPIWEFRNKFKQRLQLKLRRLTCAEWNEGEWMPICWVFR